MPFISNAQLSIIRDDNGNVLSETYPNGFFINYQYDAHGNRIGQTVSGNLLPVTLLDFIAIKKQNNVQLKWSTSQEINADKFIIEFSKDGIYFSSFDTVLAKGNTSTRSDYFTLHCCPIAGVNYYRLKIMDTDGKLTYSQIRAVVYSTSQEISIYPNPVVNGELNISLSVPLLSRSESVIYSANGSTMLVKQLPSNASLHKINVSYLPSGAYQLVIVSGGRIFAATFGKK